MAWTHVDNRWFRAQTGTRDHVQLVYIWDMNGKTYENIYQLDYFVSWLKEKHWHGNILWPSLFHRVNWNNYHGVPRIVVHQRRGNQPPWWLLTWAYRRAINAPCPFIKTYLKGPLVEFKMFCVHKYTEDFGMEAIFFFRIGQRDWKTSPFHHIHLPSIILRAPQKRRKKTMEDSIGVCYVKKESKESKHRTFTL